MTPIILLDTETTGLDPAAELVQLAWKNLATGQSFNEYFKPTSPISFGAMAVHHITNEMVADKPAFAGSKQQQDLIAMIANQGIVVAHNALFDIGVLANEGVVVERFIDTLRVARHVITSEQYKLQYLRYALGLNVEGAAHDAWGDIVVLEALFEHLKTRIKKKFKITSDQAVIETMLLLTKQPVLLQHLAFGKYVGKTFIEISQTDRGYLEWLYESELKKETQSQNEELVYTLKKYIGIKEI